MLGALAAMGCGPPSSRGVPSLDPDDIPAVEFEGLSPRSLRLKVVDKRDPRPDGSVETVEEVEATLAVLLKGANVSVVMDAKYELGVEIDYADELVPEDIADNCIQLLMSLSWRGRMLVQTQAAGCYEWRHLLGFYLGGDASRAYEQGLELALSKLDKDVGRATALVAEYEEARRGRPPL